MRAEDLAALCKGRWLSWEQALKHLAHVDLAIVCTQAPHYVIDETDIATTLSQRGPRPLLIVDLAVPRNVDPAIANQPNIILYNIDDLQAVSQVALRRREQELGRCEALTDQQVGHFLQWWHNGFNAEGDACRLVEACSS
jgi:glutamyl-tRNA reductase